MITSGQIVQEVDKGFMVFVPCINHKEQIRRSLQDVLVEFEDGRSITPAQRRKAHVLLGYIAAWWGYTPLEAAKEITKIIFRGQEYTLHDGIFSLSDCDRTTARLYITYLIDFCLLHDVPIGHDPLYELCEDIPKYVWACLMNKRCACCGKKAELHHCEGGVIGMGNNRNKVNHLGRPALPLCRKHHCEIHKIGENDFLKKYLLEPVPIDERISAIYHLNRRSVKK